MNAQLITKQLTTGTAEPALLFPQYDTVLGSIALRAFHQVDDIGLLHGWVSQDYARFWGLQGCSRQQVADAYQAVCRNSQVFIGLIQHQPAFLLEVYQPREHEVGQHYPVQPGDIGMHILLAPCQQPLPGFSWRVFCYVLQFLFAERQAQRVVVEPDSANHKIARLNRRAGFQFSQQIRLADKTADLCFCSRHHFYQALTKENLTMIPSYLLRPTALLAPQHLNPAVWQQVNRQHLAKVLSEFAHERIIAPQQLGRDGNWACFKLSTDQADIEYRFRAQLMQLNHWCIDANSIEKQQAGLLAPLSSLDFMLEIKSRLGISDERLPTYLEEIASTLASAAFKLHYPRPTARELLSADFQSVESAMTEGHPGFVANNGRIGFDATDYQQYAPELGNSIKLVWLAVSKQNAEFSASATLDYQQLLQQELSASCRQAFEQQLQQLGLAHDDYYFMPAHPWQWSNKLQTVFAGDIANRQLVFLGSGEDDYQPQQSIRTFFNRSQGHKCYVKTALSIVNMGFMRGLSPYYMASTPAINDWLAALVAQDPFLKTTGFSLLKEIAAIGYRSPLLERACSQHSPYRKMLSALWRESPLPQLEANQRLMTMAALLHIDKDGKALLAELINASGLDTAQWLSRYLAGYLTPLLHCFYAHDLVFMPHGENLIMLLEHNQPKRMLMKDIGEECAFLNKELQLPAKIQRLVVDVPEQLKILSLTTDIFDCFFRYLTPILAQQLNFSEDQFWQLVADCIYTYQAQQPQLQHKFDRYDLFAGEFTLSCLNRLQLGNNQQMLDLADPAKSLKFSGTLINPLARYRRVNTAAKPQQADVSL
ncbi:GNAT family N-acetyltransferase [Rheinheimera nanhaiensis]|uniref:Siderophore biosynthesis protein n=1 Tax=Rheinheimera nanhaiensis E407-8 TaxID=562729 RepID=I1DTH7_9GAMM|nr:GNAT family N-acetyltransferase [Rheinheimera nanhaiensis]GAB57355.1 siderophore biosynthesis protein [Rheinheimera nanhaiensis E407-8]